MRSRAAAGALLALATATSPLAAQQLRLRVGGVHARYADAVSGSAASLTSRFIWNPVGLRLRLDGSFAQFTSGPWAAQAGASVFGFRDVAPHLALGFSAAGSGGYLSGGIGSGLGAAGPVAAVVAGPWLFSVGASAGGVRRIDRERRFSVSGAAEVHRDAGRWSFDAGLTATRAGSLHYADATLDVGYGLGPLALDVLAGARTGTLGGRPWYEGRATWTFGSRVKLEAEGGSYPVDLTGFVGGAYVSVGVWIGIGRHARLSTSADIARRLAATRAGVKVESAEPGHQTVVFHVAGARSVAIAGDWNEWTPVALERVDAAHWRARLALSRGAHRFSLVVNGHRWMVPRGVATLPDDMGGKVGLLIIDR